MNCVCSYSITDYMDFNVLLNDSILSPICDINFELSEITLNHFEVITYPCSPLKYSK